MFEAPVPGGMDSSSLSDTHQEVDGNTMATLTRWNPWNDLFSLHDQLFSDAFTGVRAPARGFDAPATLPIDIRQTDTAYTIEASVPGFAPEDVEVTLDQNVLTIRGTRKQESEDRTDGWIRRERRQASVHRQVVLPAEVNQSEITAGFENGVLTITVPRTEKAQPKRIPVTTTVNALNAGPESAS